MKLFRIFAVGLILSAVVVATAIAPIGSAASSTPPPPASFSSSFFTIPTFNLSSFNSAVLNYTPIGTSTTGPTFDPPKADVVPNFSGLVVNGPTAIDSDDDGTEDLLIDEDGEIFINNYFAANANPSDGNNEIELIGNDSLILGDYPTLSSITIDNVSTHQVLIMSDQYITMWAPFVKFTTGVGDVDMEIEGDLQVDGTIQTASTIGSHYINRQLGSSTTIATATCDTGHVMTGCSGYAPSTSFKGTIPAVSSCKAYRGTSGNIYAYAHCFDPSGIKDPDTYYYP